MNRGISQISYFDFGSPGEGTVLLFGRTYLSTQSNDIISFLKKWANPGLFFVYFRLFKQTLQFLQQINVKMSIQYPALGFELTTF